MDDTHWLLATPGLFVVGLFVFAILYNWTDNFLHWKIRPIWKAEIKRLRKLEQEAEAHKTVVAIAGETIRAGDVVYLKGDGAAGNTPLAYIQKTEASDHGLME